MEPLLRGFLEYVKEVFSDEITFEKTGNPDSFEKFFGQSFLPKQNRLFDKKPYTLSQSTSPEYIGISKNQSGIEIPKRGTGSYEKASQSALFVTAA